MVADAASLKRFILLYVVIIFILHFQELQNQYHVRIANVLLRKQEFALVDTDN